MPQETKKKKSCCVIGTFQRATVNEPGLFVSFKNLSADLTQQQQQQQGSVKTTPRATGTVNNFINCLRPQLIEQKHINNMEKHFLFLMLLRHLCHLKAGYPLYHFYSSHGQTAHSLMGNCASCWTGK